MTALIKKRLPYLDNDNETTACIYFHDDKLPKKVIIYSDAVYNSLSTYIFLSYLALHLCTNE
jgi:hypothetical protein